MFRNVFDFYAFEFSVRTKSRYTRSDEIREFLDTIEATSVKRVRILASGSILCRAQPGSDHIEKEFVEGDRTKKPVPYKAERMHPQRDRATEGRVNPRGIPCLYLATNSETALSEARPWVGSLVSVAQMRLMKECRVVDCTKETMTSELAFFNGLSSPEEIENAIWGDIGRAFSEPATRDELIAEYAPTQVLSEFFRELGFDGILYRSSLGPGKNLALFDLKSAYFINCTLYRIESVRYGYVSVGDTNFDRQHYATQ